MTTDWRDLTDYCECACCGRPLAGLVQTFPAKYNIAPKPYVPCETVLCMMTGLTHAPEKHRELAELCKVKV